MSKARLIILGAGASYAVGLPDGDRVLTHLLLYITGPFTPVRNRTPMGLMSYLKTPLLTYAYNAGFRQGDRFPLDAIAESFYDALKRDLRTSQEIMTLWQAIREMLYSRSCDRAEGYAAFAASLRPTDIIVTFNWDTCLEIALQQSKQAFTLSMLSNPPRDAIRILKPHGSVDFVISEGPGPASPDAKFVEVLHPSLPIVLIPGRAIKPRLYRILTYDLSFCVWAQWNQNALQLSFGDCDQPFDLNLSPDVGPLHLERFLREPGPFLLTPSAPLPLYDWSYACVRDVIASVGKEIQSVYVVGYSFPPYDQLASDTLTMIMASIGSVPVHIINPAASSLPQDLLARIFGKYRLHNCGFLDFDWKNS